MALQDHIRPARTLLLTHLEAAHNPAFWLSGGKDSMALLLLLKSVASDVKPFTMFHVELDGASRDQSTLLDALCQRLGFAPPERIEPGMGFDAYVRAHGWPVSHLPRDTAHLPVRLSLWSQCRWTRVFSPLLCASLARESSCVFSGAKASDHDEIARQGAVVRPYANLVDDELYFDFCHVRPLFDWSDDLVLAYLKSEGVTPPPAGLSDCERCTVHPDHWRHLKRQNPDRFEALWPEVKPVFTALGDDLFGAALDLRQLVRLDAGEPETDEDGYPWPF